MADPIPAAEKSAWFQEMNKVQEELAARRLAGMVGTVRRALVESRQEDFLEARLPENIVIRVDDGDAPVGSYVRVEITAARSWILMGKILSIETRE